MSTFKGFSDKDTFTQIPDAFFHHLLNEIRDPVELRVTLYLLWRNAHLERRSHPVSLNEILADKTFMQTVTRHELEDGLHNAVDRGSFLRVDKEGGIYYFLNTPRGRSAAEALQAGDWRGIKRKTSRPPRERPNIFRRYEKSIGVLTPMMAEALKDAEKIYTEEQIEYAFAEAVKRNKRNWKYIEAILRNRKEELDAKEQDRRDPEKDRRRYIEDEFSDFIEH